jgi:hypothetical protein
MNQHIQVVHEWMQSYKFGKQSTISNSKQHQ